MTTLLVNVRRKLGVVERGIFGGFVEHLGRCIYGGIFDEGSPLSDEHGYRTDVLDLLKQMRISVLRWPGGNFVSNYHWRDGVGPRDGRPTAPRSLGAGSRATGSARMSSSNTAGNSGQSRTSASTWVRARLRRLWPGSSTATPTARRSWCGREKSTARWRHTACAIGPRQRDVR